MEIQRLEIDFDNRLLKINGKDYTETPIIVTLPGPEGWPHAMLFNADQATVPGEYLELQIECTEYNRRPGNEVAINIE